MDDKMIIEMYFARDERALEETKLKYGRLLLSVASGILADGYDVEECESDTYLRAWESIPPNNPEYLSAYLARITRNLALNRLRSNKRREANEMKAILAELHESIPLIDAELSDRIDLRGALNEFIRELDPIRRTVFIQRYFYMMPIKSIANENGFSVGTVKSILSRARARLRRYLVKRGIEV